MAKINLTQSEARKILGDNIFAEDTPKRKTGTGLPDNHANRGMKFEKIINDANEMYRKGNVAVITKVPTEFIPVRRGGQIVTAKVAHKSVVDYLGVWEGIPIAIEAKSTNQKRLAYDEVQPHQEQFLDDWMESGGRAFVLVSFGLERFFFIPWDYWSFCIACWKHKNMPDWDYDHISFGELSFPLNRKASISAEEVPVQFEVEINKRNGTFDYIGGFANVGIGWERGVIALHHNKRKKETS